MVDNTMRRRPPGYATGSDAAEVRRRELQMSLERCEEMNTERIDHAAEARKYAEKALHPSTGSPEVGLVYAQLSNAEATMALAEQQRISNLIALANGETYLARIAYGELAGGFGPEGAGVLPEIAAALGINNDKEKSK